MSDRNSALVPYVSPPAIISAHNARGYVSLQLEAHRKWMERRRLSMSEPSPVKKRFVTVKPAEPPAPEPILVAEPLEPDPQVDEANSAVRGYLIASGKFPILEIQRACARYYGITVRDIKSSMRNAIIVKPRQIAIYLTKALTVRSLPEIGKQFGGKDHTTILHAVRKIERLCNEDAVLREEVDALTRWLKGELDDAPVRRQIVPAPRARRGKTQQGRIFSDRVMTAIRDGHSTTDAVAQALDINVASAQVAIANLLRFGKVEHAGRVRRRRHYCWVYAVCEGES